VQGQSDEVDLFCPNWGPPNRIKTIRFGAISILPLDKIIGWWYTRPMKIEKATKRDTKRNKRKNGMQVSGKSVFVIQNTLIKKGVKHA
jgi:hypothetical protein